MASAAAGGLTVVYDTVTWVEIVRSQAFVASYRRTVLRHRHLGLPLVVWKDGQVVQVSADEVDLPAALPARRSTQPT